MSLDKAKKNVVVADHMLVMTYKQLKEPKLLVAVLDNLHQGLNNGLGEILQVERDFKRIPAYPDTPEGKFNVFRDRMAKKLGIEADHLRVLAEMLELHREHKAAPMEFSRNREFVIANRDYRLRTLNEDKLKKQVAVMKQVLGVLERYKNVRGF